MALNQATERKKVDAIVPLGSAVDIMGELPRIGRADNALLFFSVTLALDRIALFTIFTYLLLLNRQVVDSTFVVDFFPDKLADWMEVSAVLDGNAWALKASAFWTSPYKV